MNAEPALARTRRDRCPGVLRPWPAADGALARIRLVGGRLTTTQLAALGEIAATYGDGEVHLTGRANLQLRALPATDPTDPTLDEVVVNAIEATGLLPSRHHDQARNLLVSPLTGRTGGRADLRPVADELDRLIRAEDCLGGASGLPGRFLHVLDDGRGDLLERSGDLGLVALDATSAQLRVGEAWGPVVGLTDAPAALVDLARAFLRARGEGPDAAWHVRELSHPLAPAQPPDVRLPSPSGAPAHDDRHVGVPGGRLGPQLLARIVRRPGDLVVTPWRAILLP